MDDLYYSDYIELDKILNSQRPDRHALPLPVRVLQPRRGDDDADSDQVRRPGRDVFRDFPLAFHPNAQKAAEAARCAGEQGKFWEMHDALFANQKELAVENLKQRAKDLGLDTAKFDQCLDSGKMAEAVKADLEAGKTWGVTGPPAFFVNGRFIGGARPFEQFKSVIDDELRRKGIEPPAAPAS